MMEELDMLEALPKDSEIEIRPDIKVPEVMLKIEQPPSRARWKESRRNGAGPRIEAEVAEMGRFEQSLKTARKAR